MRKFIFSVLALGVIFVFGISSQSQGFLDAGTGARSISMGGAFVAVADDPDAVFLNPSGLTQLSSRRVVYTNASLLLTGIQGDDLGQHVVSFSLPFGGSSALGFGFQRIGSEYFSENGLTGSFAFRAGEALHFGLSASYYFWRADLSGLVTPDPLGDSVSSGGLGVDFGGLWGTPWGVNLGVFLRNINQPNISKSGDEGGKLPFDLHLGGSYGFGGGLVSVEVVLGDLAGEEVESRLVFGGEMRLVEGLVLRAGGSRIFEEGLTGGGNVGLGYSFLEGLGFDYSYNIPFDATETQGTHRFSLGYEF